MFHSPAHSFTQQARLAISLSWIAGYTNALTLLTCGQVSSHITGSVSQLGVDLAEQHGSRATYLLLLIVMFLAGAFASGLMTEFGRLRGFRSIFVLPMATEALLLGLFAVLVDWRAEGALGGHHAHVWLTFLPSFAMGLQNATITRISGGVVRTTHVTGVVTDLGLELARVVVRGEGGAGGLAGAGAGGAGAAGGGAVGLWRALLLASIPGSFALGAGLGAVCHEQFGGFSMLPAVAFLAFLVARDLLVPIAEIELRERPHDGHPLIAVFHAEPPANGGACRLPDLANWVRGLDDSVRVVVLDLSRVREIDERAAGEVRELGRVIGEMGRGVVLGGIGEGVGVGVAVGVGVGAGVEVCADVAKAMARAEAMVKGMGVEVDVAVAELASDGTGAAREATTREHEVAAR